jgi:hypothetical protein
MGSLLQPVIPPPDEVIRLLTVAVRNLSMYTHEHPAFVKVMTQFVEALLGSLTERPQFSLQVVRDQLLVEQRVLPSGPVFKTFASDLLGRGIQGITFSKAISQREILVLLEILARRSMAPLGGTTYEEEMKSKGVVRAWIHPLRANVLESGGSLGEAFLERLLAGKRVEGESRDALAEVLLRDPQSIGQTVSKMAAQATEGLEERSKWVSDRLLTLMEQLLAGHSEDWDRFKDRLTQVIVGLEVQTQLEFFHGSLLQAGATGHWARELAGTVPRNTLVELASQEIASPRSAEEKGQFLHALIPDPQTRLDLRPEVEQRLSEYGISREEFLRLLGEEPPTLQERMDLFLKDPTMSPELIEAAPGLVQELLHCGKREEGLRVVNRFFNALNHPEWEVRHGVATRMGTMFEILSGSEGKAGISRKIQEYAWRKMAAEPDREIFRQMYEALEGEAVKHLARGEVHWGLELLQKVSGAPGISSLEPNYLAQRREVIQKYLLQGSIVDQAIQDALEASEEETQRALQMIRLMGEGGAQKIIESLGEERQVGRRFRLIRLLKALDEIAVEPLKKALLDPRWFLVRNAAGVLGEIKNPGSVSALSGLLAHSEPRVRKEAVQALGAIATPRALEGVVKALEDDDEPVRFKAVEVLRTSGSSKAREKLRLIATRPGSRGPKESPLRIKALTALGALGDDEDVPFLEILLLRKGLFSKSEGEEIRRSAVVALGNILSRTRSPKALQLLRNVARTDPTPDIRNLAEQGVASYPSGGA